MTGRKRADVCEVDPLNPLATIRDGLLVLDPDLTVQFARRSFERHISQSTKRVVQGRHNEQADRL
jgi:hypothetical protein